MEAFRKFKRTFSEQGLHKANAETATNQLRALRQIISLTNDRLEATVAEYDAQVDKSDLLQNEILELRQSIHQYMKEEDALKQEIEALDSAPRRTRSRSRAQSSSRSGGNVKISVENEVEHDFVSHTFLMPTSCDQCGKLIVFGCKCTCCNFRCHNNCVPFVRPSCSKVDMGNLAREMLTTSTGSPILYHPGRQLVRMSDGEESPGSGSDAAMRKVKSAPRLQRVTSLTPQVSMYSIVEEAGSPGIPKPGLPRRATGPSRRLSDGGRQLSLNKPDLPSPLSFETTPTKDSNGGRRNLLLTLDKSHSWNDPDERERRFLQRPFSTGDRVRQLSHPYSPDEGLSDGSVELKFTAYSSTENEADFGSPLRIPGDRNNSVSVHVVAPSTDDVVGAQQYQQRSIDNFYDASQNQFSGADGGYARDITEDYEEYDYFDENGDIYSPDAYDEEGDYDYDERNSDYYEDEGEDASDVFQENDDIADFEVNHDELVYYECTGSGSFGTVYRGNWHGPVAIKKLNFKEPSEKQLDDFRNEVAVLMKCRHENIIMFMGACTIAPNFCIVTEWCEGSTLYNLLHIKDVKLSVDDILEAANETARGMGYLHAKDIIHRDLKSANIFLDQNMGVRIGDFGLAAVKAMWKGNERIEAPAGSVLWMAPEVIRLKDKNPYTVAADVYSFGVVLYEMVTGQLPYQGLFPDQIMFMVGMGLLKPDLKNAREDIPAGIIDLSQTCLSPDPTARPSFPELSQALEKLLAKIRRPVLRRADSYPPRRTRSQSRSEFFDPYAYGDVAAITSPRTAKGTYTRRRGATLTQNLVTSASTRPTRPPSDL